MQKAANGQSKTLPQYIATLCVCMGAVAAGTVLGWTSNISGKLEAGEFNDIIISKDSVGWIGSFATLGAMVMCAPIGNICDWIGRKWGCLMTVFPFTIGWLLIVFSSNTGMIFTGRFLTGLAGGAFCVAAPLYSSEIAQKEIRGALGSYFQLLLTVGILISYVGGAYLNPKNLSILCTVIPLVFTVLFFFQPETPVYLLKKNRESDALSSLKRLRGSAYDCENELKEIKEILEEDVGAKVSFLKACKTTAAKRAIFICFGLMFFQQLSGVNAVIFYTGDIFDAAESGLDSNIATIIVGVMQVAATFVSSIIVDKFGRKILLLCSIGFMMLSGFLLGIFFTLKDRVGTDITGIKFLPVLSLIVFIIMFSLGFGPIPWMISAELMPPEIKAPACSAAAIFNWFLAFIVTKFYSDIKVALGGDSTFFIFSGICALGTIFVFLFVIETKGKSVAEVQAILSGTSSEKRSEKQNDTEGIDNPSFNN